MDTSLTPRQRAVLAAVCRDYIATGELVSSARLVRAHGFSCSSATMRAELAALERAGLLEAPHHAAARKPTAAGLQRYVDEAADLRERELDKELRHAIDRTLASVAPAVDARLLATATLLSEAVDCAAVTLRERGQPAARKTTAVEVVALPDARGLVVLELEGGGNRVHPVTVVPSDDGRDPVMALREKLRWLFVGRTLAQARRRVEELLRAEEERVDTMLRHALRVGLACTADGAFDPSQVAVTGRPRLLRRLGPDAQALRPMLELLEDYHRLSGVLAELLSAPSDGFARVFVGPASVAERVSLIACRVSGGGGSTQGRAPGAIALFGPDRMDFATVIPLVEYAARALGSPHA